jgi:hypothetical protein
MCQISAVPGAVRTKLSLRPIGATCTTRSAASTYGVERTISGGVAGGHGQRARMSQPLETPVLDCHDPLRWAQPPGFRPKTSDVAIREDFGHDQRTTNLSQRQRAVIGWADERC